MTLVEWLNRYSESDPKPKITKLKEYVYYLKDERIKQGKSNKKLTSSDKLPI